MHVIGNLVWFHAEFLLANLSYMGKVVEKKHVVQMRTFREQYLLDRSQNMTRWECHRTLSPNLSPLWLHREGIHSSE